MLEQCVCCNSYPRAGPRIPQFVVGLPRVMDIAQPSDGGAPRIQFPDFWGDRVPVLTVALEDLPAGFSRMDRVGLDVRQLRPGQSPRPA